MHYSCLVCASCSFRLACKDNDQADISYILAAWPMLVSFITPYFVVCTNTHAESREAILSYMTKDGMGEYCRARACCKTVPDCD